MDISIPRQSHRQKSAGNRRQLSALRMQQEHLQDHESLVKTLKNAFGTPAWNTYLLERARRAMMPRLAGLARLELKKYDRHRDENLIEIVATESFNRAIWRFDHFQRYCEKHPSLPLDAAFWRWNKSIMGHYLIDQYRHTVRHRETSLDQWVHDEHANLDDACAQGALNNILSSGPDTVINEVCNRELEPILMQAMASTTPTSQGVLHLHAQGYTYKEMSALLGTGVGTISSRLLYARKTLREILRRQAPEYFSADKT